MISKTLVKSPMPRQAAGTEPELDAPPPRRSPFRKLAWLAVLSSAAAAAYFFVPAETWRKWTAGPTPPPPPQVRAVPVVTVPVRKGDVDLYLNGLGSVTPLHTVVMRSRVDGELIKVAFTEGQIVEKGDLLAEIDPRPFEVQKKQAEGMRLKDAAALKIAQMNLDRYTILAPNKAISQQQLDEQTTLVTQAQGAIETDLAQIKNVDLQLEYCRITAPISGTIGLRMVDPGNMVKANDPNGMAVINQLQPITVIFSIPQDSIARVQRQVNAGNKLSVDAYDRDFRTKLASGTLLAVDNQVDTATGTVRLKAVFPNEDRMLFPNQFVNARLLVETLHDAVIVPHAAIQQGPRATFAYVVGEDSTVSIHDVTLGPSEGDDTVIESGLAPGDVVVVDGVDKLQQGSKVAVRDRNAPSGGAKPSNGHATAQGS